MLNRRASWSWAWCIGAVLVLGACVHTPPVGPPVVPPVGCPAGQHAVDGVCVPDVVPPPLTCPAGQHLEAGACVPDAPPPPPVEAQPDPNLLTHAVGPKLYYRDGSEFQIREVVYCCEKTRGTGWPGVTISAIDACLRLGRCNVVHQRTGPFLTGNEPDEYPGGGAYVEVRPGVVDLTKWNEPYWKAQSEVVRYAGLHGVLVERVVVDDWGIANECWASGDYECAWYPWASRANVQGIDAHTPGAVSIWEDAFIRKNVSTTCHYPNVTYQLGQEEKNVAGYTYEITKTRAAIVRDEETKNGCEHHVLSQSSEKDESFSAPETQWTILHSYLPDDPFGDPPFKITSNNEGFNGDGTTGAEVAAAMCVAWVNGSNVSVWRGTMSDAEFTYAQGRLSQGLDACTDYERAGCSIEPCVVDQIRCGVFSNDLHDCTPKCGGRDVMAEGRTDRARCEKRGMGKDGKPGLPTFSLANATGDLSIQQRGGNPLQFTRYGQGTGDLVCTIPARGDENVCRGKDGRPFRVSR